MADLRDGGDEPRSDQARSADNCDFHFGSFRFRDDRYLLVRSMRWGRIDRLRDRHLRRRQLLKRQVLRRRLDAARMWRRDSARVAARRQQPARRRGERPQGVSGALATGQACC